MQEYLNLTEGKGDVSVSAETG